MTERPACPRDFRHEPPDATRRPLCGSGSRVIESRRTTTGEFKRRGECIVDGFRWNTVERLA